MIGRWLVENLEMMSIVMMMSSRRKRSYSVSRYERRETAACQRFDCILGLIQHGQLKKRKFEGDHLTLKMYKMQNEKYLKVTLGSWTSYESGE